MFSPTVRIITMHKPTPKLIYKPTHRPTPRLTLRVKLQTTRTASQVINPIFRAVSNRLKPLRSTQIHQPVPTLPVKTTQLAALRQQSTVLLTPPARPRLTQKPVKLKTTIRLKIKQIARRVTQLSIAMPLQMKNHRAQLEEIPVIRQQIQVMLRIAVKAIKEVRLKTTNRADLSLLTSQRAVHMPYSGTTQQLMALRFALTTTVKLVAQLSYRQPQYWILIVHTTTHHLFHDGFPLS